MESAVDRPEGKPLGRILSEERERQGLSRADAAQRLHMSPSQVEALEAGDYGRLPQGTFLRGFVRNYSRFLGLDAEAMLARLAEAAPPAPTPGIVVPSQNIRFDPLGGRLANPYVKAMGVGAILLALAFAAVYWWLFVRPQPLEVVRDKPAREAGPPQQIASAPVPASEPPPAPAPVATEPAAAPGTNGPQNSAPTASSPEPPKAEAAKAEPPRAEPKRAPARGERVIRLRFRGESWVEIRDAQGRVLVSRLHAPGSDAEIVGRPPFQVTIGNAPDVSMTYDDRDFPLEPHTKVAVARFTLE